jgi:hypothetical protein
MPERESAVRVIKRDGQGGEHRDPKSKEAHLRAHFAQVEVERSHIIKPAQAG